MQGAIENAEMTAIMVTVGIALIVIYLLPTIVALGRRHPNWLAISLLNIFAGWTFLAWIVLLFWASLNKSKRSRH
jgi:uncharacterized membrane protein